MVSATARKKHAPESYGYSIPLEIIGKTTFLSSLEGTHQEKRRCGPLRRAQESQQHIKKSIGFCMSWHVEHGSFSGIPLHSKWIPMVIRNSLKSFGKRGFPVANP